MTGLDVSRHEIVEVAALLTAPPDFTVINSYYIKVNPVHLQTANSQALEIIGYDPKVWQDAVSFTSNASGIIRFCPGLYPSWLVGAERMELSCPGPGGRTPAVFF